MDKIIVPAAVLLEMIGRCKNNELNPAAMVTIVDDGSSYKLYTQQHGEEKILSAFANRPFRPAGSNAQRDQTG